MPFLGDAVPRRGNRFTAWVCRGLLGLLGWRIVGTMPNVPKAVLMVAPHTSNWDFGLGVIAMYAIGIRVWFLGKHTLFWWPLAPVLRWLGGVAVDRRAASGVVDRIVEAFAARDELILAVTPEGTRAEVKRWKTGFYRIALGAGVPIVPVTFDYGDREVRFGPPLVPTGDLDADLQGLARFVAGSRGRRPQ